MSEFIFHPGKSVNQNIPLSRYLPLPAEQAATGWLKENLEKGSFVIDPFGASPHLAVEIAQAGYRLLVAANNPIARFLLEMTATPPKKDEMQSVLALLAATKRGDERLEPHILDLYETQCEQCERTISAEAFLWERDTMLPYAKIYTCPHCQQKGEFPVINADIEKAAKFSNASLHYFRALQRVVKSDHPDAVHVKNALDAYLPRAVYALFSILNKLDGLTINDRQRQLLFAMILHAYDKGNALWQVPNEIDRPKQLAIPSKFRENNIWHAIEESIDLWSKDLTSIELSIWPELPSENGGISIYEGRFANLAEDLNDQDIHAVLTVFPRPNQAYWTLSALWSGWFWGRDAIGPFVSVLKNSRYDWAWHTTALESTLKHLSPLLKPGTLMFGQIMESEPDFISSVVVAADVSGFQLNGQALRPSNKQVQLQWQVGGSNSVDQDKEKIIQEAAQKCLNLRGEPSAYLYIQAAALCELSKLNTIKNSGKGSAEIYSAVHAVLGHDLTFRKGFLRFNPAKETLNSGKWWLRNAQDANEPLSDRVEKSLVNHLLANPGQTFFELDQMICQLFPGLDTPDSNLIEAVLSSYAVEHKEHQWGLRPEDQPSVRRDDLLEIRQMILELGNRLGYQVIDENPILWQSEIETENYSIYLIASAVLGDIVMNTAHPPNRGVIVLPGSRAELLIYKQQEDPRLKHAVAQGWNFLKFRQVRQMINNTLISRESLKTYFADDPLADVDPQLKMF